MRPLSLVTFWCLSPKRHQNWVTKHCCDATKLDCTHWAGCSIVQIINSCSLPAVGPCQHLWGSWRRWFSAWGQQNTNKHQPHSGPQQELEPADLTFLGCSHNAGVPLRSSGECTYNRQVKWLQIINFTEFYVTAYHTNKAHRNLWSSPCIIQNLYISLF